MWREGPTGQNRPERCLSLERRLSRSRPPLPLSRSLERDRLSLERDLWRLWRWKRDFNCITTVQIHGQQVWCRWYSCTLSSGGHRALSSVHERLASGAWSCRNLHEYTLWWRTKQIVRWTENSQDVTHSKDVAYNVGNWLITGWGVLTDTHKEGVHATKGLHTRDLRFQRYICIHNIKWMFYLGLTNII